MKLETSHVDHVAKLASLTLTGPEVVAMTAELGAILKYVEELAAVDTTGIAPSHGEMPSALRPDEPAPGLSREEALSQAPRAADGGFAVPAFVEGA